MMYQHASAILNPTPLHPLSIFRAVEKAYYLLSTRSAGCCKLYIGVTDINRKMSVRFVSLIIIDYMRSASKLYRL